MDTLSPADLAAHPRLPAGRTFVDDVLAEAPLFSALDDEAATALRGVDGREPAARGDVLFHEGDSGDRLYVVTDGKVKLGRDLRRRPREPARDPRPRPDVRRALAVRPGPALGHRHRRHRRVVLLALPRGPAALARRPPRGRPRPAAQPLAGACDVPTTSSPTWCSPTSPAGSPRRCSTSPTASAAPPTTACTSTTTSPRRSSPSWSAPPARPSTRRSPTSPPAAGSASSRAPWSSWTSSASAPRPLTPPLTACSPACRFRRS